jgi:hypothetical protein
MFSDHEWRLDWIHSGIVTQTPTQDKLQFQTFAQNRTTVRPMTCFQRLEPGVVLWHRCWECKHGCSTTFRVANMDGS